LQAQIFLLRKLSLADRWSTRRCDNGSFLLFLQIVIPWRSWSSSQGSQMMNRRNLSLFTFACLNCSNPR
jgi:hypothetical protein